MARMQISVFIFLNTVCCLALFTLCFFCKAVDFLRAEPPAHFSRAESGKTRSFLARLPTLSQAIGHFVPTGSAVMGSAAEAVIGRIGEGRTALHSQPHGADFCYCVPADALCFKKKEKLGGKKGTEHCFVSVLM